MTEPRPRHKACLIVAVLVSPVIISLLIVIGFAAWIVAHQTPLQLFFLDETDQEYSDEVLEIRQGVEAELATARAELQHGLANLPPNCPLPTGWRLETMLDKAWLPVEEDAIRNLEEATFYRVYGEEDAFEAAFDELAAGISTAVESGNATALEMLFNPDGRSRDDVLREFRDYVLRAEYLDQLETAMDLGAARHIPEKPFEVDDEASRRLAIAAGLLRLRTLYALEANNLEDALDTCLRLHRLARPDVVPYANSWNRARLTKTADRSLALVMSRGEIRASWREQFLEEYARRFEGQDIKSQLVAQAVAGPNMYDAVPFFNKVRQINRLLAAVRTATAALKPPLAECRDDIRALLAEFGVETTQKNTDQSPISDVFEAMRTNPAEMLVGYDLEMILEDAPDMYRVEFTGDVARVAFALEDYRAKYGKYPETLEALVPELLEEVPVDPVFGAPLGYTPEENGYDLTLRISAQFCWKCDEERKPAFETVWSVRKDLFDEKVQQ
ncbi:MAG TPA: hypothetical protein PKY01_15900 [Candidatus Hydrogenedentes bacterium]|nr:hypothetical protein [Candidatus Hydrogenedentota bacterium]